MSDCIRDDSTECDCERCEGAEDRFWDEQEGADERQGCVLGDQCCNPNIDHTSDECSSVEMHEAWEREQDEIRSSRAETRRLRALIERPERCRFWGQLYTVTPRLIAAVFGDGEKLVCVTPMATRPNYFVVRVDSSVTNLGFAPSPSGYSNIIEDIMLAQEDEYGSYASEQEETGEDPSWPIVDWGIGCLWGKPFPVTDWKPTPSPHHPTGRQRTRRLWAKRGRR